MNRIDKVDFINSVQMILQQFIIDNMQDKFNEEVYVAYDYNDVRKIFQSDEIPSKPTFHLMLNSSNADSQRYINQSNKGQHINFKYLIFTVVDTSVYENEKRFVVLNRLASQLKHIFDNSDSLVEFNKIKIDYPNSDLSENADNLYAMQQELTFQVTKEL